MGTSQEVMGFKRQIFKVTSGCFVYKSNNIPEEGGY